MQAGARFSDEAVRQFHSQLDSEACSDIVRDSDEAFQNSENRDEIIKFLAGVHSKLGPSRGFTRWKIAPIVFGISFSTSLSVSPSLLWLFCFGCIRPKPVSGQTVRSNGLHSL